MTVFCAGWPHRWSKGACRWDFAPIGCMIEGSAAGRESWRVSERQPQPSSCLISPGAAEAAAGKFDALQG